MCNSLSGTFTVNRHFELCQESLETSSIYILDTWAEAYLWFGKKHYAEEEKVAIEIAVVYISSLLSLSLLSSLFGLSVHYIKKDYINVATDDREKNIPIWLLNESEEIPEFTCHFHAWEVPSNAKTTVHQNRERLRNARELLKEFTRNYTLSELQAQPPPVGLDKTKLESYLSDEEFLTTTQMTKEDFYKQPIWLQNNKRKALSLY